MIAIIKYKERLRVVFILGRDKDKLYVLASEQIPGKLAGPLAKTLYRFKSLSKRIEILKQDYTPIYKSAFRVLSNKNTKVIESYDKPPVSDKS